MPATSGKRHPDVKRITIIGECAGGRAIVEAMAHAGQTKKREQTEQDMSDENPTHSPRLRRSGGALSSDMTAAPVVVAEIGCNHKGDFDLAKEMIRVAAVFAECDWVKFQKRNNRELLTPEEYDAAHPVPANSYGDTYGAHREYLEFDLDQHAELKRCCQSHGIGYSTSVWDISSAREIASLRPAHIKVPSACNLDFRLLEVLAAEYDGGIHVSLGMTTGDEIERIVEFLDGLGVLDRVVLYACTSGYPIAMEDVCLLEIVRLREKFGPRIHDVGYSGHHLGIAVDMAAVALGAGWIERHFTLDRSWKGTDHAASLEPDGLRRLVRDSRAVTGAMTHKGADLLPVEEPQRAKLKRIPGADGRPCP